MDRGATAEAAATLARLDADVEALLAVDVNEVTDAGLADELRALASLSDRLAARGLAVLRRFDERVVWSSTSAAYSPAMWLANETGTAKAEAAGRVRLARTAVDMPLAVAALAAGEVTVAHVRILSRCTGPRTLEAYRRDEAMLVDHARALTADQLARAVRYWQQHVDTDGPEPADDPTRDHVSLSRTYNGRWLLRGDFCNETGTAVHAAVQETVDRLVRSDAAIRKVDPTDPLAARSAGNRRADALAELIERGAAAPDSTARRRPAFDVILDAATAVAAAGTIGNQPRARRDTPAPAESPVHQLRDGTVVSLDTVALWLCDCELGRVILDPHGEPLDVGRGARSATTAQRRGMAARGDGTCEAPGCDCPAAWADAHHIQEWEHGGPTNIDNLVLLCRHHHRRIHHNTLRVHMVGHRPTFSLPDGTPLTDRRRVPTGSDPPGG